MLKLFFLCLFSLNIYAYNTLNIASVPWKTLEDLRKFYQPLFNLIESETSYKVNFMITKNYSELAKRVENRSVDIALFGGNSYITAKYSNPSLIYLATVKNPTDHYYSLIISGKDSGLKTIEDIKDKHFAFTDIGSTSGYVYPKLMLNNEGVTNPESYFKSISMLKKHPKVYGAVAAGAIDAGGCSITALKKAQMLHGDIFHIIKKSKPIPNDPIVAGGHLDKSLIKKLKSLFQNPKSQRYFTNYNGDFEGVSVKSDSFYDIVREAKQFVDAQKSN